MHGRLRLLGSINTSHVCGAGEVLVLVLVCARRLA
jgi:hypothetical protein